MIIGLTGLNCSGKGTVADYLVENGFAYHSLSDIVREEATKRGLDHARENLVKVGNELREKEGPAVLAKMIIPRLESRAVVDSFRNPAEVEEFKKQKGFILAVVEAPDKLRFDRGLERKRIGFAKTLEDFLKEEEIENSNNPNAQQLNKCIALGDVTIKNEGSLEDLHKQIDEVLKNAET